MKKSSLKSRTFALALRQNGLSTLTAALRHWVHAILPLSSSPRGSRMFFRGMMCCALVVVHVSCSSHEHCSTVVQNGSELFNVVRSVDTVVVRDSVFVSEVMKGDTVYLTRVEWRDRWRTRMVHDTIHETQYIEKIIEKPPEKYIPNFYKHCTIYFWCAIFCILLYIVLRLTKSKLRMRF